MSSSWAVHVPLVERMHAAFSIKLSRITQSTGDQAHNEFNMGRRHILSACMRCPTSPSYLCLRQALGKALHLARASTATT